MERIDFPYIPEDIVIDHILSKLPAVSCVRFKCVCKAWYSLLSVPIFMYKNLTSYDDDDVVDEFITRHRDTIKGLKYFYLTSRDNLDSNISLTFDNELGDSHKFFLIGCINGLVCIHELAEKIFVWNPATQEIKILPQSTNYSRRVSEQHDYEVGFFFDPEVNDYKVVRFYTTLSNKAELYSFRSNSWKKIDFGMPYLQYLRPINSCGELCHWYGSYLDDPTEHVILSFDINRELFKTTVGPYIASRYRYTSFFMLKKSVATWISYDNDDYLEQIYDISVLLKIGVKESWMKLIRIGPFEIARDLDVLSCWEKGKLVLLTYEGNVIVFDPFTQEIVIVPHINGSCEFVQVMLYKRTHRHLETFIGS